MADALEIDGKFLHPIKEAAELVSYSRDYITRLAREKKITAIYVERQWFVDLKSLKSYVEISALEQEIRKKQLSAERKQENQIREATKQKYTLHLKKAESLHKRSVVVASLVLMFGLMTGLAAHRLISNPTQPQVANTFDAQEIQSPIAVVAPVVESDSPLVNAVAPDSVEFHQSEEIRLIGDIRNGVLLLPVTDQAAIAEMLSDKVVVRKLADGTEVVVRVDATGHEVGNAVPFVTVPVERQEMQI